MRVAIVHEWLETYAGSERVVEQLLHCWPQADLFAVCDFLPEAERGFLGGRTPRTTFIQRLPFARTRFRWYLGLMPLAIEQLDLAGYDLVLSSSHAVAKGVLTGPGQLHVSYVHSPMRYAWDLQHQYLRQAGLERGLRGAFTRWLLHRLRAWDRASAAGPDVLVANSTYIAERIRKAWRRDAVVIHPPVDVAAFPLQREKSGHFLVASRLVPYKRVELVAEAFRRMPERHLIVVGDGPGEAAVRAAAGDAPNIELRGRVGRAELVRLMQTARAFLHAAEEDFGIALVEAQACGTPVIAYGRGGARDIVRIPPDPAPTGLLFAEQTAEAIVAALARFDALAPAITPEACRRNAERFGAERFREEITALVARHLAGGGP
ncbi:glycosyltransferase [Caldovatus aquaticus]|uniref:Glycosyltransferase n=1 Tax=Caldovatus aquaticus TaxID=2865671 RepID=A0ABS7F538_9PROT|nr:glycosyltransferase [Caldovatus aquaticus]MBW8269875.1 glycosyltransferase [Caldovatus aquaticus]